MSDKYTYIHAKKGVRCRKEGDRYGYVQQARTQGGVRWVRTNPPLRNQLQNN